MLWLPWSWPHLELDAAFSEVGVQVIFGSGGSCHSSRVECHWRMGMHSRKLAVAAVLSVNVLWTCNKGVTYDRSVSGDGKGCMTSPLFGVNWFCFAIDIFSSHQLQWRDPEEQAKFRFYSKPNGLHWGKLTLVDFSAGWFGSPALMSFFMRRLCCA